MALALTYYALNHDLRKKEIILKAVASGNYVNNGDTLNLTAATNPKNLGNACFGFPGVIEDYEVLTSPPGYQGQLVVGANLTNWALEVFQTGAALSGPLAQLAAAAYPGAITASFFLLRFRGPKGRL